jgi:hypothetical protein
LFGTLNSKWEEKLVLQAMDYYQMWDKTLEEREDEQLRRILAEEVDSGGFSFGNLMKEIKIWLYLVSWIVKLFMLKYLNSLKNVKFFTQKMLERVKKVHIFRKIHFVLFNLVIIEIAFTGTRTLIHCKFVRFLAYHLFVTAVSYLLVIVDTVEMAFVSANIIFEAHK